MLTEFSQQLHYCFLMKTCENVWKCSQDLSSYFDLFWYRLSTTTTYWHKQTKALNTCTTLINVHCTLLTANQKWHEIMLIQPINRKRFHFDAPNASESSKVRERQKLKQLRRLWMDRRCFCWTPKMVDYVDLNSNVPLRDLIFFSVSENGKPWNKWSECDWGETELE